MSTAEQPGPEPTFEPTLPESGPPPPVPPVPSEKDPDLKLITAQYQAQLDAWTDRWKQQTSNDVTEAARRSTLSVTRTALSATRSDTDRADEAILVKAMHDAYIQVSSSSLDRAMTRVNVVTAAVASVTTVYTGLLALVYAASSSATKPLPGAAIMPAFFLGLALFLVSVYAALFKRTVGVSPLLPTGTGGQIVEYRLVTFMRWCNAGVLERSWALHAGIVSLGVGVVTLPVPFVKLHGWEQLVLLALGLVLVGAAAVGTNHNLGLQKLSHWLGVSGLGGSSQDNSADSGQTE
jgi:hypothetical protein